MTTERKNEIVHCIVRHSCCWNSCKMSCSSNNVTLSAIMACQRSYKMMMMILLMMIIIVALKGKKGARAGLEHPKPNQESQQKGPQQRYTSSLLLPYSKAESDTVCGTCSTQWVSWNNDFSSSSFTSLLTMMLYFATTSSYYIVDARML